MSYESEGGFLGRLIINNHYEAELPVPSATQPSHHPKQAGISVLIPKYRRNGNPDSESDDGEVDTEAESTEEVSEYESRPTSLAKKEKQLRLFNETIGLPPNPVPCMVNGQLAYCDSSKV